MPAAGSVSPSRLLVSSISQAENGLQTLPAPPKAEPLFIPSELPLSALTTSVIAERMMSLTWTVSKRLHLEAFKLMLSG